MRDKKLTFDGSVEGNSVKLPRDFRGRVVRFFQDREITVTVELKVPIRSNKANGYYWAVIIKEIQDGLYDCFGEQLTPKETHDFLRGRFLKVQKIDEFTAEVLLEYFKSTASLKVHEFAIYLEECIQFAAVYLNCAIPPPREKSKDYDFAEFQRPKETFEEYKARLSGYLEQVDTREELDRYFKCNGDWKREPEIRALFNARWKNLAPN